MRTKIALWLSLALSSLTAEAGPPRIEYLLRVDDRPSVVFHVTMRIPVDTSPVAVAMPASTRGAFIQNHAKFALRFAASDEKGQPLEWYRADKQTWSIRAGKARTVIVNYDVHRNEVEELRLTTNWLSPKSGFLVGSSIFMYLPDRLDEAVLLNVEVPEKWEIETPLAKGPVPASYIAADYRELADAFIQLGEMHRRTILTAGTSCHLIFDDVLPAYDEKELDNRILKVIAYQKTLFGGSPSPESWTFFHWRPDLEYGGGLARRNAIVMNIGKAWTEDLPANLIGTFAHEFFHTWNFASFYPADFMDYDFSRENYTWATWFIEGVTNYYVYLTFARTGPMKLETFLGLLSNDLVAYESSPGRGRLSLRDADRAAWIEALEYLNVSSAGAVLGFLLDLKLRLESKNGSSLDDIMRAIYEESRTKGYRGYTEQSLIETFRRVSGLDVRRFFESYVDGKGPIDYDSILKPAGLSLETATDDRGKRTYAIRMRQDISAERKDFLERLLRGTGIRPNSGSAAWLVTSRLERP